MCLNSIQSSSDYLTYPPFIELIKNYKVPAISF